MEEEEEGSQNTHSRLHAEAPVGLAGAPPAALLSSVTRLLALEQLVVQRETWKKKMKKKKRIRKWEVGEQEGGGGERKASVRLFFPPNCSCVCVLRRQKMLRSAPLQKASGTKRQPFKVFLASRFESLAFKVTLADLPGRPPVVAAPRRAFPEHATPRPSPNDPTYRLALGQPTGRK